MGTLRDSERDPSVNGHPSISRDPYLLSFSDFYFMLSVPCRPFVDNALVSHCSCSAQYFGSIAGAFYDIAGPIA